MDPLDLVSKQLQWNLAAAIEKYSGDAVAIADTMLSEDGSWLKACNNKPALLELNKFKVADKCIDLALDFSNFHIETANNDNTPVVKVETENRFRSGRGYRKIVAIHDMKRNDIVIKEIPFAWVCNRQFSNSICSECLRPLDSATMTGY